MPLAAVAPDALRAACRRDSSELTSRLGRRASAGPHQLLAGVRPQVVRNCLPTQVLHSAASGEPREMNAECS